LPLLLLVVLVLVLDFAVVPRTRRRTTTIHQRGFFRQALRRGHGPD
jgi:hypothetical protein